ncbi:RNA polymerase sigma factor [Leekyejoonella antrihumi]|uniref:RNA polymerase subunit sigma-24 n=1 Tax=Leekyejoonella antrihumi TaxID=1660198 RepID=A0A563E8T9_9MICO|nr:DUF6596 domain-containing protein [Leekyejoonella antrihumi]TWP38988.1 RNA polymerase subunit sigma-24 [Leekyejoonella antrihumi]
MARVWRDEWGRLLALLVAQTRRLDLAEDALAEAFEQATHRWPADGVPEAPAGWLLTTARRRVIDRLRAEAMHARKEPLIAMDERHRLADNESPGAPGDEVLRLVLLAAHPALSPEAGAALTLRLVLGVSTADIARLFLVSEPTMAARLTRARKKVVAAGIPLAIPDPDVLSERLDTVAQVAYLAFTAGYAPGSGPEVLRVDLAGEAIRLVRLVSAQTTQAAESPSLMALLALMLLQHSRRDARVDPGGSLVLLPNQDRTVWRQGEIAEGLDLLRRLTAGADRVAVTSLIAASYVLQALIAAEHARARTAGETDWVAIADLYRQLDELTGSPVVRLNRAVAVAEAGDVPAALALTDGVERELPHSHRAAAVRADLLARQGRVAESATAYDRAIELCGNDAERAVLQRAKRKHTRDTGRSNGIP